MAKKYYYIHIYAYVNKKKKKKNKTFPPNAAADHFAGVNKMFLRYDGGSGARPLNEGEQACTRPAPVYVLVKPVCSPSKRAKSQQYVIYRLAAEMLLKQIFTKKFGHVRKLLYLCTEFQKTNLYGYTNQV